MRTIKIQAMKRDIPENISNESEFKTNQNVDNNNEKTINTVEKQLLDLTSPRIFRQNFNR